MSGRRDRTVITADGRTLRGARLPEGRQVHLLSALDTSTGIVLAQVTVDTKSNEIPEFTPLLNTVEKVLGSLTGTLFIADAQPADLQKWVRAEWLIENQAHYIRDVTFREGQHQARTGRHGHPA